MKYYLISGEASGDLHGSNLIREIRKLDPAARIRCWGGDMMEAAGGELVMHYRERAFMGFLEVAMNIRKIIKNLRYCKEDLDAFKPDAVIFIDYPGFNIPVAQFAHKKGFKTIYYISPQVWAWKENRVKTLREVVDKMLVILPFEKAFYRKWNYAVDYVGHPLVQVVDEYKTANPQLVKPSEIHIALLPGSRMQEINIKLPIMLAVTRDFPACRFSVAQAPSLDESFYAPFIQGYPNVQLVRGKTYELLMQSHAAMVTSGTATLETALFGVPEVVCYKGSRVSYEIAKRLIKVPYISLVNLILEKPAVKELIQDDLTPKNIKTELEKLLYNQAYREEILNNYKNLWDILGKGGAASAKAAWLITDYAASGS